MTYFTIDYASAGYSRTVASFPASVVLILQAENRGEEVTPAIAHDLLQHLDLYTLPKYGEQEEEDEKIPVAWHGIRVSDAPLALQKLLQPSRTSSQEWDRWIVALDVDAALFPGMRDVSSDYAFHVLTQDGRAERISYPQLHTHCPVAGNMMVGYLHCSQCHLDGVDTCREQWLIEELRTRGRADVLEQLVQTSNKYRTGPPVIVSPHQTDPYVPMSAQQSAYEWRRALHDAVKNRSIPGFTYVSGYYTKLHRSAEQRWMHNQARLDSLTLSRSAIQSRKEKVSNRGKRAAASTKKRESLCGEEDADDACLFRESCNLWRTYDRCLRFSTRDDIRAYVREHAKRAPKRLVDVEDIQKSALIVSHEFTGVNPETGLDKQMLLGGYHQGLWQVGFKSGYGWHLNKHFGSWRELRQWVRRWAPWELKILDRAEREAANVPIDNDLRLLYTLASTVGSLRYRAGFGYSSSRVYGVSLSPLPPKFRTFNKDAPLSSWSPRVVIHAENGRTASLRGIVDFVFWHSWQRTFVPKPPRHRLHAGEGQTHPLVAKLGVEFTE